ncbi:MULTISPECIES: chlorinating enzyme [Amycolatopsis]|uniref:Chlorinating enzyme n=1 Tax=Amycolatopsis dendrobii TaxID=2760662 RepID=A0A7W3Z826_9PSEU|nr:MULTISPECIES: chlorinating enzyme [Amycolatopsis]MBB1151755.1 chlorinating enzyme [Amycolatopsis dendrobii]UKD58033.1 chlorinating enzyme [Amycolatopsis sp. FU40]
MDTIDLEAEKHVFDRQGYIGPYTLWEPEVMTAWWKQQRKQLLNPAGPSRKVFDNPVNYDRHLDIGGLGKIITEPAIVRRMQALIGPDIQCWRSEFFPKNPGDSGTGWHQVETYAIGETAKGMLEPTEHSPENPMELTAWVAFTEAAKENGCMKVLPGSHRKWRYDETAPMKWNNARADASFFGYDYNDIKIDQNWNPDEQNVTHLEMRPGQFIIFTARCIHGSNPNISNRQRMGFAIRVVPTHVRVYGGMTEFDEFGHHFDLSRHGCVQIAGKDEYGLNRIATENAWGEPFATLS